MKSSRILGGPRSYYDNTNTSRSSNIALNPALKSRISNSGSYFPDRDVDFNEVYERCDLKPFVELNLITEGKLKDIYFEKPDVIEALGHLHVTAALGVKITPGFPVLLKGPKILIEDLVELAEKDPAKLTYINRSCTEATEVIDTIKGKNYSTEDKRRFR